MSRSISGSALEARFRALVDIAGGDAYQAGAPYSAVGALGKSSLSSTLKIGNASKQEPYSLFTVQFRAGKIIRDDITYYYAAPTALLPASLTSVSADASIVAANFAFAGQNVGTNATVTVSVTKSLTPVSSGISVINQSVATLAPATIATLTISGNASLVGYTRLVCSFDPTVITGGGATDYIIDPVVTLICKAKHVA